MGIERAVGFLVLRSYEASMPAKKTPGHWGRMAPECLELGEGRPKP